FNSHNTPRGHYYSAPNLYSRGVWVGYLAPDKQNTSYLGLPSYNTLKANLKSLSPPFPQPPTRQSVTIMPLDGDDEVGMFCILLPQTLDRSIKTLQTWRPYEIRHGGYSKNFDNNFMLVTLRNTNQDMGTAETIREILDAQTSSWTPISKAAQSMARVTQTIENQDAPSRSTSTSLKRTRLRYSSDIVEAPSNHQRTRSIESFLMQASKGKHPLQGFRPTVPEART
ncbi:hypothetical protein CC86DRAFT_432406, partial [Ophiobolus disseminans]